MTFPILGGNGAVTGAFSIDNSLRFNDGDSAYLYKDFGSASNRKTWTWSGWIKRGNLGTTTGDQSIFDARESGNGNPSFEMSFDGNAGGGASNDAIDIVMFTSSIDYRLITTQVFRDVSAWYHIVFAVDTTQATASDRLKLYVNGSQITAFDTETYPSLNFEGAVNNNKRHAIGSLAYGGNYFDGYATEINFIDGQALTPSDFGEFDEDSGIWKPKRYSGSYGTNGFYLDFENSGSLGADQSGNSNNFTPTNLASTDQTTDTPTNNFATLNALQARATYGMPTLSEGNLQFGGAGHSSSWGYRGSTIEVPSGKWYCEVKCSNNSNAVIGVFNTGYYGESHFLDQNPQINTGAWGIYHDGATVTNKILNGSSSSATIDEFNDNDIVGMELDADNKTIKFYVNGSLQTGLGTSGTIDISAGTDDAFIFVALTPNGDATTFQFNFGNPPYSISSGNTDENGYGNFEYAPSSGYLALCTQNLATALSPTIDDGSAYFQTLTYAGDSSARTLTNDGNSDLQPDFIWIKSRTGAQWHHLFDSSRGGDYRLHSNSTNAESTLTNSRITSFNTDGFSTTDGENVNSSGNNYVAWQWKANSGTTSSNTDGSITSTVQANTTAGFSIVTYTSASGSQTIGHGLGKSLDMYIVKERTTSGDDWFVYHSSLGAGIKLRLSGSGASSSDTSIWNNTEPTTSVFSVGNDQGGVNQNTGGNQDYIAYCFAEIEGYSKFGTYTGNGNTDGTFVYTGFRPALVIVKKYSAGENWNMTDSTRSPFNVCQHGLSPSTSSAEDTTNGVRIDLLSNGFKPRDTAGQYNDSGASYIYMAFGHTFVDSNGNPNTAR